MKMKFIKKAAAVTAAASMVLSLSACGSNLSWAAKIGDDTTVPIGLYIYNQANDYRSCIQNAQLSTYTELSEQTVEVSGSDVNALDYLDDEALKSVKSCVGAILMAEELGVALSEEDLQNASENAAETYEQDEDVYVQNGIAQTSIEEYYKDTTRKSNVFLAKYGADGTDPVADDVLKEYFKENYATINFMQQYFYDDEGNFMSDEDIAALKKEYEDIKKKAESGKLNFVKKCEDFAKAATESSSSYKSAYTDSTSQFDPDDEDGARILGLKEGEFTMIETDSAIALVQKAKLDKDGSKFKDYRETLLLQYKYDDFIKELVKYAEDNDTVTFNDKAFEKFSSSTRDFSELNVSSYYY